MMFDHTTFKKLQVAFQAVIGLVMMALGAVQILNAGLWAMGDIRFMMLFFAIGVLFLAIGVPQFLEGGMTILFKRDE